MIGVDGACSPVLHQIAVDMAWSKIWRVIGVEVSVARGLSPDVFATGEVDGNSNCKSRRKKDGCSNDEKDDLLTRMSVDIAGNELEGW